MSFLRKIALCAKPQSGRGPDSTRRSSKGRSAQGVGGADSDAGDPDTDRVECAVCQDTPTDPCTVPCGNKHVFCLDCLRGLVFHNHYRSSFPCPLCRTRVKIPLRGLAVLKDKKGWGERLLARLALVRPRCPRRSGRHSWASSNSVGSGSSWPPPDQLLEIVLPYLEEGAGQEAGQREEPLPLDSAWLNRLRLGRLYVDTLTLTRRRPRLDSLSGSADGDEDDVDHDDDDDDVNNEDISGYEDYSTTVCLDTIDVQLQRQILEEIEREVARTRRLGIDFGEEGRGGDTDRDRPSSSPPPPPASSSGFLSVSVPDGGEDVSDYDDWDSVSQREVFIEMNSDTRVSSASKEKTEEEEGMGGVRTKSDTCDRGTEGKGAEGGERSPAPDREGDTDSLDMNCVMQLIADMERISRPREITRDVRPLDRRSPSEELPVCTAASPSGAVRESDPLDNAGRMSTLLDDTERVSRLLEGAGRGMSKLPDDTGRSAGLVDDTGRTSTLPDDTGRGAGLLDDTGRTSTLPDDTGRGAAGLLDDAGRTSRLPDGAGRGAGLAGGGSFRLIGPRAGKAASHSSERRSRSDVQAGSWLDESWKQTNPTRYCIPRPKLVGSQASVQSSHEADMSRSAGCVTTL